MSCGPDLRYPKLNRSLNALADFLEIHKEFVNAHMVDFFTKRHWENLVDAAIADELLSISDQVLSSFGTEEFFASTFVKEQKVPALAELLEAVKSHTLPALGACTEMDAAISRSTCDAVLSEAQLRLQEWCMSRKKNHEVAIMGNMIKALGDQHDTRYVVDLGSGKGYLSGNLISAHAMTVLGIESAAGNNHRAETRFSKIERASRTRRNPSAVRNATVARLSAQDRSTDESAESCSDEGPTPPSGNGGGRFRTLTARVDEDFDLGEALKKSFEDEGIDDVILCGLHTCGDLATSALKLFVRCPRAKVLCLVGCCYHLTEEEFVTPQNGGKQFGFPMSRALRKRKYVLGRNARMLAAQCAERNKEEKKVLPNSLFYRALLQLVLSEKLGDEAASLDQVKVGKLGSASSSFTDYVCRALNKLKLRHVGITPDEIRAYEEEYTKQLRRLTAFQQMRIAFAACVEALVLLDRLVYLLEQEAVADAHIVRLFDPVTSPRCYALCAVKKTAREKC
ncbi:methyltransferase-like protein 25 [Ixodes scapularis]|uniref:methyltransferase-like protein 25 n=1 Tax=Ixodes scapularis TaxID=6945 RepID=UPI001A9E61C9|nr:methyltransferase-like protein 25 [Ixodes scapularis]